ncbi:organic cation transporter protein-like [Uloborus diversus]|uniref:organic cation transporter protein-like n=1 Tax=Uloborus diversus TaxID=327109 RepID=UPI0024092E19|nr:organic cation transporter protein-like [Uloborus diversus]
MEFEDILLEVGDYGKYQKDLIMIFLVPAASLLPWFSMNVLFMVSVPEHWCYVPEVASLNLSISEQRALISPPKGITDSPSCYMYDVNYTDYLTGGNYTVPDNASIKSCDRGWQYDTTYYDSTAATKWDMVCSDGHYTSFVLTLYNVGSIIGTPIYGLLSDRIGRKLVFFITIVVTAVTAISSVLMTDFTAFVVIKTINGSLMPSVFQLPYIIILEIVGPEMRTRMNGIVNCSWTFGLCFLPLIAYLSRSWVTLGLVTSSVTLIFFLYWTFLPESPRWLVSQERYEEATVIMSKIAEKNGKPQDYKELLSKLQKLGEKIKKEKKVDGVENSSADLLRYPQLRKKFIIITFCWMADIMAYYGLQLNVSNLAGNEFINFFLLALVEVPGYLTCWVVMEKFGRRWCTVAGFLLTGIACMLPSIEFQYGDVICSLIGKFFAAGTFMATYQQSSELYPTVVRSLGMGMSSTVAFVATLIVPYLVWLSVYGKAIPFIIIGSSCLMAGLLASFLPETLNENLPQTIFDAEEFGRHQKFFSCNRRRRSLSRDRASSFGLKAKAMEIFATNESSEVNARRASQILRNRDFIPERKPSADQEKIVNGELRKRNATDPEVERSRSTDPEVPEAPAAESPGVGEQSGQNESEVSEGREPEVKSANLNEPRVSAELGNDRLPSVEDVSVPNEITEKEFAYVNLVFENIDKNEAHKIANGIENKNCS